MKILRKVFRIEPEVVHEHYYFKVEIAGKRAPNYDYPQLDKIEEELLKQLNDWLKGSKETEIISFTMNRNIATLEIFYSMPDGV